MKFQSNPTVKSFVYRAILSWDRVARIASILATRNLGQPGIANSQSSALFRKLALVSEIMAESKCSSSLP